MIILSDIASLMGRALIVLVVTRVDFDERLGVSC